MARKPKRQSAHPDLEYHLLGVAVNIVELQAQIQRDWELCFAQPFPGWSRDALSAVAAFAGMPADSADKDSFVTIYRRAIEKKSAAKLTPADARAKFCFEQWQAGKTYKEINAALKRHVEWEHFNDERKVRGPITTWSARIGVKPRRGQPGRRAKT